MMKKSIITANKADTDRGQVGIGTLIVFIALVLVAAIAAGVLINTAGFLQSQAESTGQESTNQVSDNLEVVNTIGEVETAGEVGKIELTVTKAPGSDTIDLRQLAIQYVGPGGSEIIELSGEDASGADIPSADGTLDYGLQQVQSENNFVLSEDRDQYKIIIGIGPSGSNTVGSGDAIGTLQKDDDATLTINTAQGSQQTVDVTIPGSVDTASSNEDLRI